MGACGGLNTISFTDPHLQAFVLVTGDADFLHVITALRGRGVRVVLIGVSNSTSHWLNMTVDELVFYDTDIEPAPHRAGGCRACGSASRGGPAGDPVRDDSGVRPTARDVSG